MAYITTNLNKSVLFISKDLEQLQGQCPSYEMYEVGTGGHMINISDADFNLLVTGEKMVIVNNDLSVTLRDPIGNISSKEELDTFISDIKKKITRVLPFKKDGSFKNELIAYKTLLENLDTSSISFPIVSLEKYLKDQNQPFLNSLQIC